MHVRPKLLAHDRISAIGPDQKISRLMGAVVEVRGHPSCRKVLIDPYKSLSLMIVLVAEGCLQRRVDQRPGRLGLRRVVLRLDRPVWLQHGAVRGPYAEIDFSKIDAHPPEHFDHLRLENDAAAATVEVVGRAFKDVDVPADLSRETL
jgi:hypothetical protein